MKWLSSLLTLFLISSCGQDFSTSGRSNKSTSFSATTCSCSDNKQPVCGSLNGKLTTYINACVAQCNGAEYTDGICQNSALANEGTQCNINSGTLCGRVKTVCDASQGACTQIVNPAKYFTNQCVLLQSGAEQLDLSECY
jgi:hypothetical protein